MSTRQAMSLPSGTGSLETLYDAGRGVSLPLPAALAGFYGSLRLPLRAGSPYVIANLVSSLDGVVSLGTPGMAGGKEISGANRQDRALMGLLRGAADAVVVGAGTVREGRGLPLTPASAYAPLAGAYGELRAGLGKASDPLSVVVTASGRLDPSMRLFQGDAPVLIVTTAEGARRVSELGLDCSVRVAEVDAGSTGAIPANAVLKAIRTVQDCSVVLVEGGPHLLGDFLDEGLIDEQFLTLAPQVVGRDASGERLALVEGRTFAPHRPLWSTLSSVKRGESHLFLRYTFGAGDRGSGFGDQ